MVKKMLLSLGFIAFSLIIKAQNYYAVKVTDTKTEKAILGVSIKIKSTGSAVITNESGTQVIQAAPTDSIFLTAKGYISREISLANQSSAILVYMVPEKSIKPKTNKQSKTKHRH